jgi:hypothetical protein
VPGTREYFLLVAQLQCWGTIQEYVELCRGQGYFTPAFYATAIAQMERIHVRRRLKQVTTARGWPVFGNITRVRDDVRPERVFLQEELFGPEEYRQIVAYHYGMACHHLFKAQTYRNHAKARFSVQLPLFDEDDGGGAARLRPASRSTSGAGSSRDISLGRRRVPQGPHQGGDPAHERPARQEVECRNRRALPMPPRVRRQGGHDVGRQQHERREDSPMLRHGAHLAEHQLHDHSAANDPDEPPHSVVDGLGSLQLLNFWRR